MNRNIPRRTFEVFVILVLVLSASGVVHAQSARARGMGGAFLGISDDESAIYFNPAGLSQIQGREASLQTKVNDRDLFEWSSAAFTGHIYEDNPKEQFSITDYLEHNVLEEPLPRRPKYSYGFGYTHDYRSLEFGKLVGGSFLGTQREIQEFQLAFGTRFPIARRMLAREQLYGGINLKAMNVDRWVRSLGTHTKRDVWGMGVGLMYHYNDRITGGLTVDNVIERVEGSGATRDGVALNLGTAYRLTKGTLISADATNILSSPRAPQQQYRVGIEKKFIENDLTLRMGSWNGTLTMGFGMQVLPNFRFDYAYYAGDVNPVDGTYDSTTHNGSLIREHYIAGHLTFD